jgi:hypothetical protein
MNIKYATLIALCGYSAAVATNLLAMFAIHYPYGYVITDIVAPSTLVVFLFTLYRKQS